MHDSDSLLAHLQVNMALLHQPVIKTKIQMWGIFKSRKTIKNIVVRKTHYAK